MEKTQSNKTPALTKSTNKGIWVVGTTKKLTVQMVQQKNNVVTGKTPFFVIGPFCSHHFICLNIGF